MKLTWIDTAGHCYLRVTHKQLEKSGVKDKISGYSGINAHYVYLEEDVDAGIYLESLGITSMRDFENNPDNYNSVIFANSCTSHNYKKEWVSVTLQSGDKVQRTINDKLESYTLCNKRKKTWIATHNRTRVKYRISLKQIYSEFTPILEK